MPVAVHGILSVGDLAPHRVGDELMLWLARPLDIAIGVPVVRTEDFLQEENVGRQPVQALLHLVDDHPPGEMGETLVNVVRRDSKTHRWICSRLPPLRWPSTETALRAAGTGLR